MEIEKLVIKEDSVLNGKTGYLMKVSEARKFVDGRITDEVEGYKAEIVAPQNGYEKLIVRVENKPGITNEQIAAAETVKCTFDGFEAKIYRDYKKGGYGLSCRAKSIVFVK